MSSPTISTTLRLALASGSGGALASVFAKLAFDDNIIPQLLTGVMAEWVMVVRACCFVGIFLSNVVMMALFARCLQESNSLSATVSSCASNFCFTGLFGYLVFHEHLSFKWLLGAVCLVVGLFFIQSDPSTLDQKKKVS